ncbi:hypothetical protein ACJJTC_008474 [Scirpophaga incertulas]
MTKVENEINKKATILFLPRARDKILSAVSRYNRAHPNNKLCSSLLGMINDNNAVYVSEHLSPANKSLHAATRMEAKDHNYKFVWVRNGRVFMRKDETSRFIHVGSRGFLDSFSW